MIYTILTIIYLIILFIIGAFVVWEIFTTKKITEKIIGALFLVLVILRLLLIK